LSGGFLFDGIGAIYPFEFNQSGDGEGVGVFGSGGRAVPWSDRFLCDEDCGREAAVGRG